MNIDDVREWIELADIDLDSAILLNGAVRKHELIFTTNHTNQHEQKRRIYHGGHGVTRRKYRIILEYAINFSFSFSVFPVIHSPV